MLPAFVVLWAIPEEEAQRVSLAVIGATGLACGAHLKNFRQMSVISVTDYQSKFKTLSYPQ